MPAKGPATLPQEYWDELQINFQSPDNLTKLFRLLSLWLEWRLGFRRPLAQKVARALPEAILKKLVQYHPHEALRDPSALVKTYWGQTGELITQALAHFADLWLQDLVEHPSDTAAARLQRLLPSLSRLPNRRGKTNMGESYYLRLCVVYDDALKKIRDAGLGDRAWRHDLGVRDAYLQERQEKLRQLFPDATARELRTWAPLSPSDIAARVTVKQAPAISRPTPGHVKRGIVPKMRPWAQALDAANPQLS